MPKNDEPAGDRRDDIQRGEGTYKTKVGAFERRQRDHVAYQPISVRARHRQAASARAHRNLKPMRFVSLHHHSTYSFLDGFQLPEAHIRRAAEINMPALAMTEHGNTFSHVKLEQAAVAAGVKPIFGCEFYVGWTDEKRRAQRKNHLTVLAKNAEGYRNLLELVSRSWREGFYYEPTVDWRWLVESQRGLVVLSGCQGGALFTAMVGGKHVAEEDASYRRGLSVARWMAERFEDFYIEVQAFPELEKTRLANPMLARVARAVHRPLVATMDCHYTAIEEAEVQQILHNVRPGEQRTLEDQVRDWGYEVPLCHPPTDNTVYRRLVATGLTKAEATEAIVSTESIAQGCTVELPQLPHVEFPLPDGYDSAIDLWRDWLREGWRYRGCDQLASDERERYKAQLAKEMEVIEAKGYVGYFLIVADAIVFAKGEGIPVGPARGSAAASICCWLLRITEVNPMLFDNLVFERFIDWNREDMPDIDIDFASFGRARVREYLRGKYPDVNNIGTFTMYKSKLALDDVARVHGIPKRAVDTVKELLVERSSGDLRASATIEDTVDQFDAAYEVFEEHPSLSAAMDLEGNAKGFGVHAAGLVISNGPITEVASVLERTVNGEVYTVVSMDKYDAERQGLEKLDFLGLSTMDMIHAALGQIGMTLEDLYAIPLDDEATIDGFRRNDVVGIFQFDGRATRIVCGALKPDNFHEIVCVNALSRPGPLHNGAVQGYVAGKWHADQALDLNDPIHPAFSKVTADTQHQIIFQEQILRLVREVGDFSWTHAAYIRKIISKKLGDAEFNRQKETFLTGATKVHERDPDVPPMDRATAERIWGMCITAGSYAFNAAHATAYSTIAVWQMWIKQHHPQAFFAAALAEMPAGRSGAGSGGIAGVTTSRQQDLLRDAVKGNGPRPGVEVLPPDVTSDAKWRGESVTAIRAGWTQIPGIALKTAEKIIALRDDDGLMTYSDLASVHGIGPKTVDKVAEFCEREDPFGIYALEDALADVKADLEDGILDRKGDRLPVPTHRADGIFEADPNDTIIFLGQPIHRNLRDLFESNRAKTGEALKESEVRRADLSQWCVLLVRDEDELASFVVSRYKYPRFKDMLWKVELGGSELMLIRGNKGTMKGTLGDRSGIVFVDDIWVLDSESD
jgi:DNA polymerase-3 subunit alpha